MKKINLETLNTIEKEIIELKNENKNIYNNYEKIKTLHEIQKNKIQELKALNVILKEEIENIKKETPEHIKIKIEALKLLTQTIIAINNNSNFLTKIEELKILSNNNITIIEYLEELKNFNKNKINIDIIMKDFYLESGNNKLLYDNIELKNKNLNNVTKNIIKIKKIKKKENIQEIKKIIDTIQTYIENLDYNGAISIIKKNRLEDEFSKTIVNLENKIKFDILINKLIYLF